MLYKCDSCGSSMIYDPEQRMLVCPHCGSKRPDMPQGQTTEGQNCPTCGAPLTGTDRALIAQCSYCGTWLSIDPNLENTDAPKKIMPFSFGRKQARRQVLAAFDNIPFLPKNFLADPEGSDIQALYAPFWLYPVQVKGHYEYEAEMTLTYGDETEHRKYYLERDALSTFNGIPVDALESLEDLTIDAAVGGDGKNMQDFDPVYLAGTDAVLPEKPADDPRYLQRASSWADMSADAKAESRLTSGFTSAVCASRSVDRDLDAGSAQSVLLPVYRYEYNSFGKHKIYIDGHTGKMSGDAPCDKGRVLLHYLIEMVCAGISLAAIVGIVGVLL